MLKCAPPGCSTRFQRIMGSLPDPERPPVSGMLIYIYSANEYRRLTFPVEWIRSIFVMVFDENAKELTLF